MKQTKGQTNTDTLSATEKTANNPDTSKFKTHQEVFWILKTICPFVRLLSEAGVLHYES